MTVIAWDGKTLAADKRSVLHGKATTVTKLFEVNGWLLAFSGDLVKGLEMVEWFRNGRDAKELPVFQRDKEDYVPMLAISSGAEIFHFEDSPIPFRVEDSIYAMGSGRDFALAAMHLGCDARKAVEVACALHNGCGNGIDTLTLHPVPFDFDKGPLVALYAMGA